MDPEREDYAESGPDPGPALVTLGVVGGVALLGLSLFLLALVFVVLLSR
jgi:hypothetical protein